MSKIDNVKNNVIAWYPFKENSKILYLTLENYDSEMKNNEQYDYIVMLGTLEYADALINEKHPYTKLLQSLKTKLKDDGTILFTMNNRMGVRYLSGDKSDHCEKIYDSVKNKFKTGRMFSKSEIINIIDECEFKYRRFYYPLPNCEYANVIYTDDLLPDKNDSKINYNVIYNEGSLVVQDETMLLKQFLREGNFTEYTNSYLVELSNSEINTNIKYISYNNMRKDEYSLILKIYNNKVVKEIKSEEAKEHLNSIKRNTDELRKLGFELAEVENQEDENVIVENLIKYPLLDSYLTALIKKKKIDETYEVIDDWYNYIRGKLNVDENDRIKDGFIDLVFENTFYNEVEKKYIFFDQEWYVENIPVRFILYRAIKNLYSHNKSLNNNLPIEDLEKRYNIETNEEFEQLENDLQDKVIDEEKRSFYGEQYNHLITSEEIIKNIEDLKRFDKDNSELAKENERQAQIIHEMQNGIGVTADAADMSTLRFVKNKIKKLLRK